jgi:hypothetical protein
MTKIDFCDRVPLEARYLNGFDVRMLIVPGIETVSFNPTRFYTRGKQKREYGIKNFSDPIHFLSFVPGKKTLNTRGYVDMWMGKEKNEFFFFFLVKI